MFKTYLTLTGSFLSGASSIAMNIRHEKLYGGLLLTCFCGLYGMCDGWGSGEALLLKLLLNESFSLPETKERYKSVTDLYTHFNIM